MTDRHRSFTTAANRDVQITFDLDGETFHCVTDMPVVLLREIAVPGVKPFQWGLDFMRHVIIKEDRDRFEALLNDTDRVVTAQVFSDICLWVLEQLTGNPTQQSSSSADGSSTTTTSESGTGSALVAV